MAVALILDFPGEGLKDHDATCEVLNWPADWAEGCIVHGASESEDGLRVLDIWESCEHFDRFVETRLRSAIGQAMGGRAQQPQITEIELSRLDKQ